MSHEPGFVDIDSTESRLYFNDWESQEHHRLARATTPRLGFPSSEQVTWEIELASYRD